MYKHRLLFLDDFKKSCCKWEPCFLLGKINGGRLLLIFLAHHLVLFSTVRKGYRIQADKERDSMKVLYYVEKELAQFDPARRMRGRCEHLLVLCNVCTVQESIANGDSGVTKLRQPRAFRVRASRDTGDTILKKVASSTQRGEQRVSGVKNRAIMCHPGLYCVSPWGRQYCWRCAILRLEVFY